MLNLKLKAAVIALSHLETGLTVEIIVMMQQKYVSKGSVLGPLLFLIYINDICKAVAKAKVKLYADDTNVHSEP